MARTFVNLYRAAGEEHLGLETDGSQLFHRMLCWLGFCLAGSGNIGNQGQMHEQCMSRTQFQLQLSHCLKKRLTFYVADSPAHLDYRHINAVGAELDSPNNLISHVGDNLHRAT